MINVNTLRPMHDDVLMMHEPMEEKQTIVIKDDIDNNTSLQFRVLKVSPTVEHIKVGDLVIAAWRKCVPPFEIVVDDEIKSVTITDEKEILGIIEETYDH